MFERNSSISSSFLAAINSTYLIESDYYLVKDLTIEAAFVVVLLLPLFLLASNILLVVVSFEG